MINVTRLIQKIKEKALRDGDRYGTISEADFQEAQEHLQRKIPEKHPGATPYRLQLVLANSLCHYFWGERQAETVFPEEFTLHAIQEQPQETIVPQVAPSNKETQGVAPQPEASLVNQSTLAPPQHQTVASFNGWTPLQWMNFCKDSPHIAEMMYADFRAATGQATSLAESSTHHKSSENPQEKLIESPQNNQQHPMSN